MRVAHLALLALAMCGCATFHRGPMPGEPEDAHYAEVEGVRIRYVDEGQGPVVVMLHGYASSLETWDAVRPVLITNGYRVVALDLKGFGWTDRPEGDYSPRAQARLVRAFLDARGVDRFSVAAHSWGTSVALAVALEVPERVERLALYDAWVYDDQLPAFFRWARFDGIGEALFGLFYEERPDERLALAFYDKRILSEELAEKVELAMERPGTVAAALAVARGQDFESVEREYRKIRQPVLLLWGREDVVSRMVFAERLLRDLRNARLVVYPRCGHFPMIEAIAASNRDLVAFLQTPTASLSEASTSTVGGAP